MLVDTDRGARRAMRTRSRYAKLLKLFPPSADILLNARIARLCVLYEDLRIEITGLLIPPPNGDDERGLVAQFDVAGYKYRELYFLRRSIGTCREFAEAIRLLEETPGFQKLVSGLPTANQKEWRRAVEYFRSKEKFWKKIRNDVGGHFGPEAAKFAVSSFLPDAGGRVEIQLSHGGKEGAVLEFSSEIAATALLRHLPGDHPVVKFKALCAEVLAALPFAVKAVEYVVATHLWRRSG